MRIKKSDQGIQLWLSANDTYNWANKIGASWPCSDLSGHRLYAEFGKTGDLVDYTYTIDGKTEYCPQNEFDAITSDFINREKK